MSLRRKALANHKKAETFHKKNTTKYYFFFFRYSFLHKQNNRLHVSVKMPNFAPRKQNNENENVNANENERRQS
ncbi:MAG: hypothetical protein IKQ68_02230, partial [Prevotella sp.]|nr:hypothetical protein [Prevotella sp.]